MIDLGSELRELTIVVTSPDRGIGAILCGRRDMRIAIRPDAYKEYDERSLEWQLAQTGKLLWLNYRRSYDSVLKKHGMKVIAEPDDADDETGRRLRRVRDDMVVSATSPRGVITLRTRALLRWNVTIADGAVAYYDRAAFTAEVNAVVKELFANWDQAVRWTRLEILQPKRARRLREARLGGHSGRTGSLADQRV